MKPMPSPPYRRTIFVCCNERDPGEAACANRGSRELQKKLKEYVKERGLQGKIRVTRSLCFGLCAVGPNICAQPENVWYNDVREQDLPNLIREWIDPLAADRAEDGTERT